MDDFDHWAVRIALRVAPDERDVAARVAHAYAAGGKARHDMFRPAGHVPGGIGGGLATVLPDVLDAVAFCGDAIRAVLGDEPGVAAGVLLAALGGRRDDEAASEGSEGSEVSREASREAIDAALRLRDRLRDRGLEEAAAEQLACDVLAELLAAEDPAQAREFLDRLVANEAPEPLDPEPSALRRVFRRVTRRRRGPRANPPPDRGPEAE